MSLCKCARVAIPGIVFLVVSCLQLSSVQAQSYWNRTSGNQVWHSHSNWLGGVPGYNDFVYFRNGVNGTVYVNSGTSLAYRTFFNYSNNSASNFVQATFNGHPSYGLFSREIYLGYNTSRRAHVQLDGGRHRATSFFRINEGSELTVRNNAFVDVSGSLATYGARNQQGGTVIARDAIVQGGSAALNLSGGIFSVPRIQVLNGSRVNQTGGEVRTSTFSSNYSDYDLSGGTFSTQFLQVGGNVGFDITGSGTATVSGQLQVASGGELNVNGGTLDVGTIDLSGGGQLNFQSGTLSADRVVGDVVQNGGVWSPGASPGLTEITGNFEMTAGMIAFELAGLSRGNQFDAVDVSGSATLNGTMDIDFIDGFEASLGDSFFLVDAASYSGSPTFDFADASLSGGLVWDTSSFLSTGSISVVAVPEPSVFGVLAALGCVALARRRKA